MEMKMIGSKIAEARKKMKVSQAELAQRLFISPQAVGKWERGESIPDLITFNRLAKVLGVDLNYFSADFPSTEAQFQPKTTGSSQSAEAKDLVNFIGSNLDGSDFANITAHKRRFHGSALRGSDFSGADLTESSFTSSDMREANFDRANLTDCLFSALDLTDASFHQTTLLRTEFSKSSLIRVNFSDTKLSGVKLTKTDLRTTLFKSCIFENVDFKYSDLSGVSLDGQVFMGVQFTNTALNGTTFKDTTLRNVSFRAQYALTNKYYRTLQTICFDGAMMDKLTYAVLKGVGVDLSRVTTI